MLNLDLLKVFISVAENSGFTRAAGELHRTQSAISMQIKRLEEILGVPVFQRNAKSIVLSPEGKIFIEYARRILRLVDEAMSAVNSRARTRTLRVGCIEDYAARILPGILAEFWTDNPEVHIELSTGETDQILARLGIDFDLAIAMHPADSGEGRVVYRDAMVWATSPTLSPHEHVPLPVALRPEGCLERQWATVALDSANRPWRCAYVSAGIGTLQTAVGAGLAIGMFKASTVPSNLRLLSKDQGFPELPQVDIALHIAPSAKLDGPLEKLVDKISNYLAKRATMPTATGAATAKPTVKKRSNRTRASL